MMQANAVTGAIITREHFPYFVEHGKVGNAEPLHYLDNAASTQIAYRALDAMLRYENSGRANVQRSSHSLAEQATLAYENARRQVAAYLGVEAQEILFTSGTTHGLNLLAHGLSHNFKAGDEVCLSQAEHHSNIVPWLELKRRRGIGLRYLPVTANGEIDLTNLDEILNPRVKLISLTHASNVSGAVTDIASLSKAAQSKNIPLIVDGAQAIAHEPVNLSELGADFYVFSGHKVFSANGIGVLWCKRERWPELQPFMGGGGMISQVEEQSYVAAPGLACFEAGTPPVAQALGLGAVLSWLATLDRAAWRRHEMSLLRRLTDGLKTMPGVRLIGSRNQASQLPIMSFALAGIHAHDLSHLLNTQKVAVRGGHLCAQPMLAAMGVETLTRVSIAPYNSEADIDALLTATEQARRVLR